MKVFFKRLALDSALVVATLLFLELAVRLHRGMLTSTDNQIVRYRLEHKAEEFLFDERLGWVPRPGSVIPVGNSMRLTVLENGMRSNGSGARAELAPRPVIVAVGDSFTFGSEESDDCTWPAHLERRLGVRVLNGGVGGYGFDQIVLRAEILGRELKPDVLVVGLIPDDVRRCALSVHDGAPKPFFRVRDGRLTPENPVVTQHARDMGFFRSVFGYSCLVDFVMSKRDPGRWYGGEAAETQEDYLEIGSLLVKRLEQLRRELGIPVVLLIQYPSRMFVKTEEMAMRDAVVGSAADTQLHVLNLQFDLVSILKQNRVLYEALFYGLGHMTCAGNDYVAQVLAQFLAREQVLTP